MPALEGRKLWLIGIGGAGMSAYAQLARAWGAEVGGWDRVETPYLAALDGIEVQISPEPAVPDGFEVVVSSAYPSVPGRSRSEFLAELAGLRRTIVVGGTHGKGTTAAMIAFALREAGDDPSWLIGAPVPQLGSNAGAGEGWLVVEGDESDRTVFGLPAEIAVITNVELDHHSEFRSLAELEAEFDRWARSARHAVRDAPPFVGPLALPGDHNRQNAGNALAALELAGMERGAAVDALARFEGTGRRFELSDVRGVTLVDDYAHHPAEIAATISAAREAFPDRRLRALFQPHLVSRTRYLAADLGKALAAADDVVVTDVYLAREAPDPAVTGKLVVDALSDLGRLAAWIPELVEAADYLAARAEAGDVLLVLGAGSIDRAPALIRAALEARR
ncbi:MAG TPA: cyanophycin synthetase [Gaiellaceae bacterium]|nr:cyanophycin synthetase [Gaiellaceae bacterium]